MLIISALWLGIVEAAASDRYVSQHTGRDQTLTGINNDCKNPAAPCRTIQHAIDEAGWQPGSRDEIKVTDGIDSEHLSEIGCLSELHTLYLRNNHLSGSLPPEVGRLTKLRSLNLFNNPIGGNIPARFDYSKAFGTTKEPLITSLTTNDSACRKEVRDGKE